MPPEPFDESLGVLRKLPGDKLDADCVEALLQNKRSLREIRQRFRDEGLEEPA